ncbi:gliding motility protein GldN [Hoylesella saccharolytica]|uniref:type IX secretion system ring protein PorN/GldN n=1 Tax=Hoylesella saccharolytica TaxID=633701 RepID=UPI0028D5A838|nr:gliding motility protein GldN [Hoylesella saccharolytica]
MLRYLFILIISCSVTSLFAQPKARRQQQQQASTSSRDQLTTRARISFPVENKMSEDVVWRRDIYRELDLNNEANAGLYYPVEPVGGQMNLFTYIFKLMMTGQIRVYEYRLDGNESFEDSARVKPKAFLDNYHIFYERKDGRIRIDNSDIPSREVTAYYLKESAYYDQSTATFHTKVLALCPIMKRQDDFGDGATTYPLFWIRYDDLAPFLAKQTIMTSNLNNAATMSIADFFTLNKYRGKIYKTTNMLGLTLAQYCKNDSAIGKEQKRIEDEIIAFEKNMWGQNQRKEQTDSIAPVADTKKAKKPAATNRRSSATVTNRRTKTASSSSTSAVPRVTVRRQRH